MRIYQKYLVVALLCILAFAGGYLGIRQRRQVWGDGDLPIRYREMFGNSNTSRLNYVQHQVLDKLTNDMKKLDGRVKGLENRLIIDANSFQGE